MATLMLIACFGVLIATAVATLGIYPGGGGGGQSDYPDTYPGSGGRRVCLVPSLASHGGPASCEGYTGAYCPQQSDKCVMEPGSTGGDCCLGCYYRGPIRDYICGGSRDILCPRGFYCQKSLHFPYSLGVCCEYGYRRGSKKYRG